MDSFLPINSSHHSFCIILFCWFFRTPVQFGPTIMPVQACITLPGQLWQPQFSGFQFSNHLLYVSSKKVSNLPFGSCHAHQQPSIVPNQSKNGGSTHAGPYCQHKTSTYSSKPSVFIFSIKTPSPRCYVRHFPECSPNMVCPFVSFNPAKFYQPSRPCSKCSLARPLQPMGPLPSEWTGTLFLHSQSLFHWTKTWHEGKTMFGSHVGLGKTGLTEGQQFCCFWAYPSAQCVDMHLHEGRYGIQLIIICYHRFLLT